MTLPDHIPYLTSGDLRTAEDVLKWMKSQPRYPFEGDLVRDLEERLDRERHQACKVGALAMIRRIVAEKRSLRLDYERYGGREKFGTFAKCMANQRESRWGANLRKALAFRAASRGNQQETK